MNIFLSYRRDDSIDITDRIYDRLKDKFGRESVFKDTDSIPLGRDFRREIEEAVNRCDVFIAVIGGKWVQITNEAGQRRLDDPDDFVRIEIEVALRRELLVIPVLVDGVSTPTPADLPESLRALAFRHGTVVRPDPDFHSDVNRVIRNLERYVVVDDETGAWTVNLGYGFAFYVNCSGASKLTAPKYRALAQLVAEPCQELGLKTAVPDLKSYSTKTALAVGDRIAGELRLTSPRLASVFEFVWQIMLLLFATEEAHEAPHEEREVMESTLSRAARNAEMLDTYSKRLIHALAWGDQTPQEKKDAQDSFVAWAHTAVAEQNTA